MFYPENLKKGYKIGVSAPSAGMSSIPDQARLESGIRHFQELGYPVILTEHVSSEERGASASGKIRAKELTELFQNPEVRLSLRHRRRLSVQMPSSWTWM
jgi:muramoyltetrapeptide carboxypeptidase LdcA involved in peptidoglycan recycling